MSVEEVREMVEHIRAGCDDPEGAHSTQDALYLAVLTAIAAGHADAPALAAEAIKAAEIEFPRWYA